jgi:lysophospholipase L1-like esterase
MCQRNIRVIVDRLRQKGIQVVLLTILPYGEPGSPPPPNWSNEIRVAVDRTNVVLRTLAGPGVTVFDADRILTGPDGWRKPPYSADSEHLNAAGYAALNPALMAVLEPLVRHSGERGVSPP